MIWAEFQNWVRICLWSESGFRSESVFGPNCRRAFRVSWFLKGHLFLIKKLNKFSQNVVDEKGKKLIQIS